MLKYQQEITAWQAERDRELRDPDGWLTLAGLFWLETGRNSFGSDPTNTLQFPDKAAPYLGTFVVTDESVQVEIVPKVTVTNDGQPINTLEMTGGGMDKPVLAFGSLRWFVIRRDGRWAVRLRDVEHSALKAFHGMSYFPIDAAWRVDAYLEAHPMPLTVPVPTILGSINQTPSPGILRFSLHGQEQSLIALGAIDKPLSVIFADATSGKETYGSGRFLTVPAPNKDGWTTIDFNQAYNPPCAFTPFATCPLPPKGNRLPIPIPAGEKSTGIINSSVVY